MIISFPSFKRVRLVFRRKPKSKRKEGKIVEIKFKVIVEKDPETEEFEFGTIEEVQAKLEELQPAEPEPAKE